MKTTITYTGTRSQKINKAGKDAIKYLGKEKTAMLKEYIVDIKSKSGIKIAIKHAYILCGVAGLEGLPVLGLVKHSIKE